MRAKRPKNFRLYLDYAPNTGLFTWKVNIGKARVGEIAGTPHAKGYIAISVVGQVVLAHRLAWWFVHGKFPDGRLDHRDMDKTNNSIGNLREATNAQNHANRGPQKNNTSGYKGVYWWKTGQKWKSQIVVHGKSHFLGYFGTKEEAADAYEAAAERYQGEFCHRRAI